MKFTVTYLPSPEQDLTAIWLDAPDRQDVANAANAIDQMLATDPLGAGESRTGPTRILVVEPLAVLFDVIVDDLKVKVWQIWRWSP